MRCNLVLLQAAALGAPAYTGGQHVGESSAEDGFISQRAHSLVTPRQTLTSRYSEVHDIGSRRILRKDRQKEEEQQQQEDGRGKKEKGHKKKRGQDEHDEKQDDKQDKGHKKKQDQGEKKEKGKEKGGKHTREGNGEKESDSSSGDSKGNSKTGKGDGENKDVEPEEGDATSKRSETSLTACWRKKLKTSARTSANRTRRRGC